MFEQSSIDTRGMLKSPWAFTASILGQTLLFSAAVVVSLIQTEAMPRGFLSTRLTSPGVPLPRAVPSTGSSIVQRTPVSHSPFVPTARHAETGSARSESATVLLSGDGPGIDIGAGGDIVGLPGGIGLPGVGPVHVPPPPHTPVVRKQEKPAEPVTSKPIAVSSGVQAAKLMRQVNPVYPPLAVKARIAGTVRLVAIIGRDGAIENLRVVSGHPLLTTAAVEAVKQWRYRPTLLSNEPVEVITQIDVNFTLSRD
jgi:protein TonB